MTLTSDQLHIPVLKNEVLEMFSVFKGEPKTYIDGTFGRGGHVQAIFDQYPQIKVIALDRDPSAIEFGKQRFSEQYQKAQIEFHHGTYLKFIQEHPNTQCDLILLDLGVSSPQLDESQRGFSFYQEGPLDMRMNTDQELTAADVINDWDEDELIEVFKSYGEVKSPYRVVKAIVHDRKSKPFTSTTQLAGMIERVAGWRQKGKHPATQYFLGLRLAVNQELEQVEEALPLFMQALVPGGVVVVLTFHSLEDRIVKRIFRDSDIGRRLNKKVICATDEEQKTNSRARSAKLRAFQKELL